MTDTPFDQSYPFDEFCKHYDELHDGDYFGPDRRQDDSHDEPSFEKSLFVVMEYMKQHYDDQQERLFKGSRFVMIMNYLSHHIDDFDTSDYLVYGSPKVGALASDHLLRAIHDFFTSPELLQDNTEPTPKQVMGLADSLRE